MENRRKQSAHFLLEPTIVIIWEGNVRFSVEQLHGMETLYGKFLRCIQDGGHV